MPLRLAGEGFYGGDPAAVKRAPADDVMAAFHYLGFRADYEAVYLELNRGRP